LRTEPSLLLPIFRSDGQRRLLARLYLGPEKAAPLAELARDLQLDRGNVKREADRLERAGLIRSERIGRQRILRANPESPYFRDLYGLLVKAFGPETFVGAELEKVDGIERAYLYGSWAARYHGEAGLDPADIDVIAVGHPSRIAIAGAERRLAEQLGREVNVTVVTPEEWEAAESGFLTEVRQSPLVHVQLRPSGDT
jgi:DNA-binding transcriptional ArsR family regulator